jgi:hypothetical protein
MRAELHTTMGTLLTPAARSSYPCEGRSSVTSSISIYTSLRCTYLHITDQYLSKAATRVPRFQYYNSPNVLRPLHLSPLLHHPHRNVHHQPPQTHAHDPRRRSLRARKSRHNVLRGRMGSLGRTNLAGGLCAMSDAYVFF